MLLPKEFPPIALFEIIVFCESIDENLEFQKNDQIVKF